MKLLNYEQRKKEASEAVLEAVKSGDDEATTKALNGMFDCIYEKVKADFDEYKETQDEKVLASRGYRQLTKDEKTFYNALKKSLKSASPKQVLVEEIPDGMFPTTIVDDIYKEIRSEHPILEKINFQFVGFITRWFMTDHVSNKAVWGEITDEITSEIKAGLKEVNVMQNKISAYILVAKGLIDMGLTFIDNYVREILIEVIQLGLEEGVISGNGVNTPIGMTRKIKEGTAHDDIDGYPEKTAVKVKSFAPKEYGTLLAPLAKTEKGKSRKFSEVLLICNMADYLAKIMPATTAQQSDGTYRNNIFPFPTDVVVSEAIPEGKAVIGLASEYNLLLGGSKEGTFIYDDSAKFLEDMRAYLLKLYASGRAYDDTCFILIDISELEEYYITVKNITETAGTTQAETIVSA